MTSDAGTDSLRQTSHATVVRRNLKLSGVVVALVAALALTMATSACTPGGTPQQAVQYWWGSDTWCANRIVQRESGFNPYAVNRTSGATGLFQLMPSHASWIKAEFGYDFSEMKDSSKNAQVARALYWRAYRYWGDGWQPWRISSSAIRGGGCPA